MLSSHDLKRRVFAMLREELGQAGLLRRDDRTYTWDLGGDAVGWLGLQIATYRKEGFAVSPVIGVRHEVVERLLAGFLGTKPHPYLPATIGVHLGYLMPDERHVSWNFAPDADISPTVENLVEAFLSHGRPFASQNRSLDAIVKRMEEPGYGSADSHAYRLPIAYSLRGEYHRAVSFLREYGRKIEGLPGPAAEEYRGFAKAVTDQLVRQESLS
jgi:hypothetical protein